MSLVDNFIHLSLIKDKFNFKHCVKYFQLKTLLYNQIQYWPESQNKDLKREEDSVKYSAENVTNLWGFYSPQNVLISLSIGNGVSDTDTVTL